MAKKKSEDFRDLIIDAINNTDNFGILRSIARELDRKSFKLNLSIFEFHSMLDDCTIKMKECFGANKKEFLPLKCLEIVKSSVYFKKLQTAFDSYKKFDGLDSFESIKYRINIEINDAKSEADFAHASELRSILEKVDDKYEVAEELIANHLKNSDDFYIDFLNGKNILDVDSQIKFITWDDTITESNAINMSDVTFYLKIQESIRKYLIFLFISKKENYLLNLYKSPLRFLCSYDGKVIVDFEHVSLLYDYLVDINSPYQKEVKGVLYYLGMERISHEIEEFYKHSIIKGISIKTYPYNFGVQGNYSGYNSQYMSNYILPEGYRGYLFEPKSLLQQSFLSSIFSDAGYIYLDNMVSKYTEAQKLMKQHKNGLFFKFLDKEAEEKIMPMILKGQVPLQYMTGKYTELLLKEYEDRRNKFSESKNAESNIDIYSKVVLPFALEVLGSYIRQFCSDIIKETNKDIYVYYMNSHSIAIAVSETITDEYLAEKLGSVFVNSLKPINRLSVSEIIENRNF